MQICLFTGETLDVALSGLATVAAAPTALSERERTLLTVLCELHARAGLAPADAAARAALTTPLPPAEVAARLPDPLMRRRLVQLAIVMAIVDRRVTPQQEQALRALAAALAVHDPGLRVIHHLVRRRFKLVRALMVPRLVRGVARTALREEGVRGVLRILEPMFVKRQSRPEVTRRYRQLAELPLGTFGRTFFDHCSERGFSFAGEPGGIPERVVFHDLGHVLAGYDTDPPGEIQQGAFQAGFMRHDGYAFLLFVILQFDWGIKITPISPAYTGHFDIAKVLTALDRGAACGVDLSNDYDFFADAPRPIDEVRAQMHIEPALA